jgi:hypothetical protein
MGRVGGRWPHVPGAADRQASSVMAEVVVLDGEDSGRGTTLAVGADPILLGGGSRGWAAPA